MDVREKLNSILTEVKPAKNLESVQNIIEGGYLDSFELMLLISRLGEEFGIEIDIDEIIPENFNSVDAMCGMIERLRTKR